MTTFISYSRADSAFVVRLAKDLKAAGIDVWVDQLDIPKGTRWDDEIEAAVEKSSTFMVVLAPESMESQNVKDELSYAIDAGKHILPVIIKPCKVPLRLRRFQHVDFTDKPYKESLAEIKRLLSDTQRIPKGAVEQTKSVTDPKDIPAAFKGTRPPPVGKDKSAEKTPARKIVMPAVIIGVLGIILAGVFMASKDGLFSPPPATATSTVTAVPPTATQPAPTTISVISTAPAAGQFYTEEFTGGTFDWSPVMVKGVQEKQVNTIPANGSLMIQLSPYQKEEPYVMYVNEDYKYSDVALEATVTNNGNNANLAVLACRIGESGWYAFEISSGGTYSIKAFDKTGKFKEGYKELTNGGSNAIKYGKTSNIYRAICQGNDLILIVNDTQVAEYTDTVFNFAEGNIGIGADSPQKLPVDLQFDTLKVSEP